MDSTGSGQGAPLASGQRIWRSDPLLFRRRRRGPASEHGRREPFSVRVVEAFFPVVTLLLARIYTLRILG